MVVVDVGAAVAAVAVGAAETDMICDNTNRLLLQFHITGRCNLRCKHCYRTEGDVQPLSTSDVLGVIDQFVVLLKRYNALHGISKRGHINITGGEPFIREDIDIILDYIGDQSEILSFGILSNGTFLDEKAMELLLRNGVSFIQLSIDGDRTTHDALRAPGDYDRTFRTARTLERRGIRTYISFTANRDNYRYLPSVAMACRKAGVTKLWTDRLVPIGNGAQLESGSITLELLPDYLKALKKAQGNRILRLFCPKTQVTANRALQFQGALGSVYSCSAGDSLITVDEFGQIMPCRRMPVICGSIREGTLEQIYFEHEVFRSLRKRDIPQACSGCLYSHYCRGGAKCQGYAVSGQLLYADPACPLKRQG